MAVLGVKAVKAVKVYGDKDASVCYIQDSHRKSLPLFSLNR